MERFVNVEGLDLQEEWLTAVILFEPLYGTSHYLSREEVFLAPKVPNVGIVASSPVPRAPFFYVLNPLRYCLVIRNRLFPVVDLVSADQLRSLEGLQITVGLLFPVMVVVGDNGGGVTLSFEKPRKASVERF